MSAKDFLPEKENPVKKYWKYIGKTGNFSRWSKQESTNYFTEDLTFIILEQCIFISGFHSKTNSGIISNFVLNTKTDDLNVRTFGGLEIAKGKYQDIKDTIKANGGKFTKGYFIYNIESKEIEHLALSGAGLGDPEQKERVKIKNAFKYKLGKGDLKKNGATEFYYLNWTSVLKISVEEYEEALAKALVVDDYIADYFGRNKTLEPEIREPEQTHFEADDLPVITDEEFGEIQNIMPF